MIISDGFEASAPAKIILFGEHAVVYGQPALAAPVSALRARATTCAAEPGTGVVLNIADIGQSLTIRDGKTVPDHPLARACIRCLEAVNAWPADFLVTMRSDIPIASGLGSGAALTAALMRSLARAADRELDDGALNALVYEVEREFHGTPSGIDNTVVVYERAISFVRGTSPALLTVGRSFDLIVADTGVRASTKESVGDVQTLVQSIPELAMPIIEEIGELSRNAMNAIRCGQTEALGPLMNQNHDLLKELTVSSPELETLVYAARGAGAIGAKLSGGGRGGHMIALGTPGSETVIEQALTDAGARRVFRTRIEAHA